MVEGAADAERVCVGAFAGAQGVRGQVRIKSFTAVAENIVAYGPLQDEAGTRTFEIAFHGAARGLIVATIVGVADRGSAEALRGTRLYAARVNLPPPDDDDEFYHADLLGLEAVGKDGAMIGRISAILPAGGADVLEIDRGGELQPLLVPFTREDAPVVDIARRRIVVIPLPDGEDDDERGGS